MSLEPEVAQPGHTRTAATQQVAAQATPVGFEPTRGDPIGLAGRRLSRSAKVSSDELSGTTTTDLAKLWTERLPDCPPPMTANCLSRSANVSSDELSGTSTSDVAELQSERLPPPHDCQLPVTSSLLAGRSCRQAVVLRAGSSPAWPHTHGCKAAGGCASDTCGIRAHAGRPHRLSRPTP